MNPACLDNLVLLTADEADAHDAETRVTLNPKP